MLLHGKIANDNGFVSIAGVRVAVTEEIPIINTTEFEMNSFIQVPRLSFFMAAEDWRRIEGRDGAKQQSRQIRSMCTEKL